MRVLVTGAGDAFLFGALDELHQRTVITTLIYVGGLVDNMASCWAASRRVKRWRCKPGLARKGQVEALFSWQPELLVVFQGGDPALVARAAAAGVKIMDMRVSGALELPSRPVSEKQAEVPDKRKRAHSALSGASRPWPNGHATATGLRAAPVGIPGL